MLYKFKSKATGDLIMLEPQGRHILTLLGKEAGPQGIILVVEMLPAIDALHAAVLHEEEAHKAAQAAHGVTAQESGGEVDKDAHAGARAITLRQRVTPFIDMLRRAHAENADVVWGV